MKAKKLVSLALPVMLLAGCTTETYGLTQSEFRKVDKEFKADEMIEHMKKMHYRDEEIEKQLRGALAQLEYEEEQRNEKKTDSLKVSESEKKKDESIDKEADKLYKEKEDLLAEKKAKEEKEVTEKKEESNKEVAKEDSDDKLVEDAVIKEGRTLAEERAYIDKQLNNESSQSSPLEQYQEKVKKTSKELLTAIQSSKSLLEKDRTMQTTQSELKGQLSVISGRVNRLATIEPPEGYYYFKEQLRDDSKVIKQVVDQAFIAFNENDTEKAQANIDAMMEYLDTMSSTLNEIRNVQNGV